ncbi:hypothetical protein [Pantoea agglomerans]|uniref:hypothetical protein n=1 Tax=Enterobacter agglomerans TaxID=549 RepID=UPI0034CEBEFA
MSNFEYKEEHELDQHKNIVSEYDDFEEATPEEEEELDNEEYKKRQLIKNIASQNADGKSNYDPIVEESFWCDSTYAIHPNGFYKRKKKKSGDLHWVKIHPFYVIPFAILEEKPSEDEDAGNVDEATPVHVKVKFKSNLGVEKIAKLNSRENADICSSYSRLVKDAGWMPPADKSDIVRAYTSALAEGTHPQIRENGKTYPAFIEIETGFKDRGWVDDETHIRSYHPRYVGNIKTSTGQAGSFEVQKEIFNEVIEESPLFAFLSSLSFSSYIRGKISTIDSSLIAALYGTQELGKSTKIGFLSSIEGKPRKMVIPTENSTYIGIQQLLVAYKDGPFFMEEMDDLLRTGSNDELGKLIMTLSNQGNGVKFNNEHGHEMRGTWNNTIFSVSNLDLSELIAGDRKEGALETRLLPLSIDDEELHGFFPDKQDGGKIDYWKEMLNKNYGHFYPKIIEEIVKQGDSLIEKFQNHMSGLRNNKDHQYFNSNKRKSIALAMANIGADLMGEILGEKARKHAFVAIEIYKNKFTQKDDEVDINKRADFQVLESFYGWIVANASQMHHKGYAYVSGDFSNDYEKEKQQASQVQYLNNIALKNGSLIADIDLKRPLEYKDDFEGEILINELGKQDLRRKFSIDFNELVSSCRKLGLIKTQKSAKSDAIKIETKKYEHLAKQDKKFPTRQVVILLKPLREIIEEDIEARNAEKTSGYDYLAPTLNNSNEALLNELIDNTEGLF